MTNATAPTTTGGTRSSIRVRDRALRVAAAVGMRFAINQLDVVLRRELTPVVAAKIALTFAVPYAVSRYAALPVSRAR